MDERFEIFYIRHASCQYDDHEDRDTCDVRLDDLGEEQILLLGERFSGCRFDAVFASPLIRAVKTAAAVCNKLEERPTVELLPQIMENGSTKGYFGESLEYLNRYYDSLVYNRNIPLMPDNETDEQNDARAKAVLEYFKSRFTYGQKIAVFAHGSFGTNFLRTAVGIGESDFIFSLNHTSVSKIKYTPDGKKRISFANDFSHLRPLMPDYEFTV